MRHVLFFWGCFCCCSVRAFIPGRASFLALASPPPVSSHIRNRDQVMYYTLKQRPAFRHDSTEGLWVMKQTDTLGTWPDVHISCAVPEKASVETVWTDRQHLRIFPTRFQLIS